MGNTEKLMNQIINLKFTAKSLQKQAKKCVEDEKTEKLKVKKAIEKGNMGWRKNLRRKTPSESVPRQLNYGLEVSVGLPQAAAHAVAAPKDDLSRRLAELKNRG